MPRALARCCEITGFLKMRTGDAASARTHYERSLALYRKIGAQREVLRMLGNHADLTWALGDLDAALDGFRETIALLRSSTFATKNMLGFNLGNLAGVQTERGELDEALAAAREGLPLLSGDGSRLDRHGSFRPARSSCREDRERARGSRVTRIPHTRPRKRRAGPTRPAPADGCKRCYKKNSPLTNLRVWRSKALPFPKTKPVHWHWTSNLVANISALGRTRR